MNISDIKTIEITPEMMSEAQADAEMMKVKWGRGTRAAAADRDIVGSLAHQAVEIQLSYWDRPFVSTRTVKESRGDKGDIFYDEDSIDVKGAKGTLNQFYFYNEGFLVFDEERAGMPAKGITHFVFVLVDLPNELTHIYGAISLPDFEDKAKAVVTKYGASHSIRAYQLKPFANYINRV